MNEKKKNIHAVALSKLGASKGGLARAAKLSKERRIEIAQKAVNARWEKARRRRMSKQGMTATYAKKE